LRRFSVAAPKQAPYNARLLRAPEQQRTRWEHPRNYNLLKRLKFFRLSLVEKWGA
jgi:hypothetical protein